MSPPIGSVNANSTPQRILEILRLDGGWMTIQQIQADFDTRWPNVTLNTLSRAFYRLADTPHVSRRRMDNPAGNGWSPVGDITELRIL